MQVQVTSLVKGDGKCLPQLMCYMCMCGQCHALVYMCVHLEEPSDEVVPSPGWPCSFFNK